MPRQPLLLSLAILAACGGGLRSYSGETVAPIPDAFACARDQLQALEYELVLVDSIGGLLQGRREITGLGEAARRGASAATGVLTVGLAGGKLRRYDEITVFIYQRRFPRGNTIEATAGMFTVTDEAREQSAPTDDAKRDARRLVRSCAGS